MGRVDGGVIVGRTLVHACVKDPAQFEQTAERARYCQLLAGKLRLSPEDAHRVVLAAWLSAIDHMKDAIAPLVAEYEVADIMDPAEQANPESANTGAQILSLVMGYQALEQQEPDIEKDTGAVRKSLHELWAVSEARQQILGKFIRILEDEKFLFGLEVPAARVLIVDPAEVVSTMLTLPLVGQGYAVDAVGNVTEAEQAIKESLPDLIIAEMNIPVENGVSLCRKVREQPETKDIPFIMLTTSKSSRVQRECLKAGADEVIMRPVDMELFFIRLSKLLEAKTQVMPVAGIGGSLKDIGLSDLIQILCASAKSERVTLIQDDEEGSIYIREGEIVHAETADLQGDLAFYKLVTWKTGSFAAERCDHFPPRTIEAPAMSLLMEGARRADEGITA